MRLERTIAVLVLATGATLVGDARAQAPAGVTAASPPAGRTMATTSWKPAELRPEHAILARLAGHWQATVHVASISSNVRIKDTQGTADGKPILGGLFVEVTHSQTRMKEAFEGRMIYGFDVAIGKFTADWIDASSTAIIHYIGTYDADKKQLTMSAHYSGQKSHQLVISKLVTTFMDDNTWTYEEYVSHAVGEQERPVVGVTLKRG
jgi:hypothetical protein